ncbi:MAG TPA: TRIC cation channel family protein [Burkholderiales bacterium]|nr:TRIC cation channel family protein [Burkholderiales bacterium]
MPGIPFLLPIEFDLAATFLMALTGVWVASRRGYDLVGAFMLAFVTGVGGGLLRDAVFIKQVPLVMQDARYLWAVAAAVVAGTLTHRLAERFERSIAYVDALAIGVYGVVGANKAMIAGIAPVSALLVGMCNAVGGGMLRDVLVRDEPLVFKPGQLYALAALGGCVLFVVLSYYYGVDTNHAAWISITATLVLRLLAIRFNWATTSLRHWGGRSDDPPAP